MNAAPLSFIFPALCVLKLQNDKILSWQNLDKLLLAAFGVLLSFAGLVMALIEMVKGVKCSHGKEPDYCDDDDSDSHEWIFNTSWSTPNGVT